MPSERYIGPERRKNTERRRIFIGGDGRDGDRRVTADRRQEAQAGVMVNFTAEDMAVLIEVARCQELDRAPSMTYDEIIAREA